MNQTLKYVRVALAVAVLILIGSRQQILAATPAAAVVVDWCHNVCEEEISCTEVCLFASGQDPAVEITCGEYDGGPTNDWCNGNGCEDECSWWSTGEQVCWWENQETDCAGYGEFGFCGDDICVPAQGENCSACDEDCGTCPTPPVCSNSVCELGETWWSCPQDCPGPSGPETCPDGVCSENEDGYTCPADCTFSGDWCGGFQECPDGWECIDEVCVWETSPLYKCCGQPKNTGAYFCLNGPEVCNANEECKDQFNDPDFPLICVPLWWTQPTGTVQ